MLVGEVSVVDRCFNSTGLIVCARVEAFNPELPEFKAAVPQQVFRVTTGESSSATAPFATVSHWCQAIPADTRPLVSRCFLDFLESSNSSNVSQWWKKCYSVLIRVPY